MLDTALTILVYAIIIAVFITVVIFILRAGFDDRGEQSSDYSTPPWTSTTYEFKPDAKKEDVIAFLEKKQKANATPFRYSRSIYPEGFVAPSKKDIHETREFVVPPPINPPTGGTIL